MEFTREKEGREEEIVSLDRADLLWNLSSFRLHLDRRIGGKYWWKNIKWLHMYDRFENCFNDSKNSSKEELKEN